MEKLPIEILIRVFDKLCFNQKIQCTLVCQQWAKVIHSYSLLCHLTIQNTSSTNSIESWEKRIQQQPRLGKQVRQLLLFEGIKKEWNAVTLPILFPFLRSISLSKTNTSHFTFDNNEEEEEDRSFQFKPWHDRLESLIETSNSIFTYELLGTGIFHCLHTITIRESTKPGISLDRLFERLANAPFLQHLKLEGFLVNTKLLELLHKYATKLTLLHIENSCIPDNVLPNSIQPIDSIHTFDLSRLVFTDDTISHWTNYILVKYPNVTDLTFGIIPSNIEGIDDNQVYYSMLSTMLEGFGVQLKRLCTTTNPLKSEHFEILDKKKAKLDTLQMNAFWDSSIMDVLFASNQLQHLRSLSIMNIQTSDLSWLTSAIHLEYLKLDFQLQDVDDGQHKILLNQLLSFCPDTLKSLVIVHGDLTIGAAVACANSNIQVLKVKHGDIDEHAIAYMSEHCQQLNTLSFRDCTIDSWTIHLPKHTISYFEITTPHNKTSVRITSKDGTRMYVPNHRFSNVRQSMMKNTIRIDKFATPRSTLTNMVESDPDSKTTIHLTCRSLYNLFLNGHFAF